MKKIIIILFLFPHLIFASFPIENLITDTISKEGRIYIKIDSDNINKIDSEAFEKEQNINNKNNDVIKNKKRSRTSGLLGFFGGFLLIAIILAVFVGVLIIRFIIVAFASFANSDV
tara:strand:+ start:101 stop:448 length:348 start_codon:yes stop_codon:yes gene_type:complete